MTSAQGSRTGQPGGVRATVGLLLSLPVLVLLLAMLLIWLAERDSVRATEERLATATRLLAANGRLMIQSTLDKLAQADEALGADPKSFRPNGAQAGLLFMAVYDANGATITANGGRGASVASNPDFQALVHGKAWVITPLIGTNQTLRLFGIGRRIERDGRFAASLTAFLPADALSEIWTTVALGANSTLVLFRSDGQLVTRFPVPEKGFDLSQNELFTEHLPKASKGVFQTGTWPIDGRARTIAYEELEDLGIVAVATISRSTASGGFWARVWSIALFAAPAFIALVFLCGWTVMLLLRQERTRVELEQALAQNRLLFQEIHHRVKNNLQAVASLVRLQSAPAGMKEDLIRRISAMTAVHQHMYESDRFGELDAGAYLAKLLASLKESAPPGVELDWRLQPVLISVDQALPLGLIVNEVAANAFKHAFPDGRAGKVSVTLHRPDGDKRAILAIADNGIGMPEAAAPGGVGLGTRLISSLASQLEGESTLIRADGIRFELRFPVGG